MYAVDVFIDRLEADVRRSNILTVDDFTNINSLVYDEASDTMMPLRTLLAQPEPMQTDYESEGIRA